jgi:hypothetical protein
VIVDYLSYDKKPRAVVWCRLTGLQLLGILLANGYVLYDKLRDSSYISESVWYEKILHNLLGSKKVYCMCAEVVGLALEMHKKRESGECPLEQLLRDRIALMFTKEDHIRALDCLNIVAKYYPAFVDSFFLRIFDQLKRFSSDAKVSALSLILQRVDEIEDAFKKLQPRLNELLIHRCVVMIFIERMKQLCVCVCVCVCVCDSHSLFSSSFFVVCVGMTKCNILCYEFSTNYFLVSMRRK